MALLVPNEGERKMLDMNLSEVAPGSQTLHLYTNNKDPAEGDNAASYTEAAFTGYAAVVLARATWGAASTDGAGVTSKAYPQQTFTFLGAGTIVGYYVTETVSGILLWAERLFAGAGQAFNIGDQLKLTPKIEGD